MARKDLLSEAIADAKAVKETALANAKLALEEAFTPKLQSMISAKLAEELDDDEVDEDVYEEDEMEDEVDTVEEPVDAELEMEDEEEVVEMEDEEEVVEMEDEEVEEDVYEEDEDDLDLESIIRELEMHDDEVEEGVYEDEEELTEEEEEIEEDEELDLDEVINALREMEGDDEELKEDEVEAEDADLEAELEEAYDTIKSLQSTINEVNLLNAKLLYTNKLFRTFDLNESQKVKVLENFDRTSSVREVKLVFSTIAENLNVAKKTKKKRTIVKEGYASKPTKSSAPKKEIISEGNMMAARWKKLAGLK